MLLRRRGGRLRAASVRVTRASGMTSSLSWHHGIPCERRVGPGMREGGKPTSRGDAVLTIPHCKSPGFIRIFRPYRGGCHFCLQPNSAVLLFSAPFQHLRFKKARLKSAGLTLCCFQLIRTYNPTPNDPKLSQSRHSPGSFHSYTMATDSPVTHVTFLCQLRGR